jgi:subtilase family serine protease
VKASGLPASIPGAPHACAAAGSEVSLGAVTDDQVAHAYGGDGLYMAGDLGAGQTVDIFELEPFFESDVKAFDECYFRADHTSQITVRKLDGGAGTGEGSGEAALDVETVSAIAPAADIDVYEGPDTTIGSLDVYDAMVVADNARVISTSWGLCESALQAGAPGTQAIENSIFMEAAAQGQSIFAAAGDDGSDDCAGEDPSPVSPNLSVDDPGSQPYVVSVGGTTFLTRTEPPDETVWNDGNSGGAGGGGVSETWPRPTWQLDSRVPGVTDNRYAA